MNNRVTQKSRKLAARMFDAEEARERVSDLKNKEYNIFQDTLIEFFKKIEGSILEKKHEVKVHLNEKFPEDRLTSITKFFEDLDYVIDFKKIENNHYVFIQW